MLQQWAWTLCDEFCEPLEIDIKPGIHYPDESASELSDMTSLMSNLKVENTPSTSEYNAVLSMTGVSILKIYYRNLYINRYIIYTYLNSFIKFYILLSMIFINYLIIGK